MCVSCIRRCNESIGGLIDISVPTAATDVGLSGSVPYEGLRRLLLDPALPSVENLTLFRVQRPEDGERAVALLAQGLRQQQWRRLRVGELPPKTDMARLLHALLSTSSDAGDENGSGSGSEQRTTAAEVVLRNSAPQREHAVLEGLELEALVDSLVRQERLLCHVIPRLSHLYRLSLRGCMISRIGPRLALR